MIRSALGMVVMVAASLGVSVGCAEAAFTFQSYNSGVLNGTTTDSSGQFSLQAMSSAPGTTVGNGTGTQTVEIAFLQQSVTPTPSTASSAFVSATVKIVIADSKGSTGDLTISEGGTGIVGSTGSFSVVFRIGLDKTSLVVGDTLFTFQGFKGYNLISGGTPGSGAYTFSGTGNTSTPLIAVFQASGAGAVPEPSSLLMVALGGLGLTAVRLRRRTAA